MRRPGIRATWVSAGLVFAGVTLAPRVARAVYQCGDQTDDCKCGAYDPYPCCDNGGNCTWWAWEAACCNWAVGLPGWGNANQWAGNAKLDPNYDVLASPVVGSIACRVSGTYGHVAWVTSVNGSTITVTEENCCTSCNYGMRTATYDASHFDGGFIVRAGQCECSPGQTQAEDCGNCGQRERGCGDDCKWSTWGSCAGEGECAKGQTDEQACGDCGKHARTCDDTCHWGQFGACSGPDPNDACDTGQKGVCADGTTKCVDGTLQCAPVTASSDEICDGLDNDCNGQIDDHGVCADSGVFPGQDAGSAGADGGRDGSTADSSWPDSAGTSSSPGAIGSTASGVSNDANCACGVAGRGGGAGASLALGLLVLLGNRARRRKRGFRSAE